MVRSSGFGSTICNYGALFELAFASAPCLKHLTLLHTVTRRPVLQKVRDQTIVSWQVVLSLLVSIQFQVLFHSPPGVLFTVPSRYYSLSVTRSYLALWDGPHIFARDFTCPVLLWNSLDGFSISVTGLLPCFVQLSRSLHLSSNLSHRGPKPLANFFARFGLLQFRSPLLPQSFFYFLFLCLLSCFSSAGSPHNIMNSCYVTTTWLVVCFHIRKSTDNRLFASPRCLSQLITSFIGA